VISELLALYARRRRFQRLVEIITPSVTQASLVRVDKTLSDAYAKATAQGASTEDYQKHFNQAVVDRTNDMLCKENAVRIAQWAKAILEEESRL
jgi:hypothetical protein